MEESEEAEEDETEEKKEDGREERGGERYMLRIGARCGRSRLKSVPPLLVRESQADKRRVKSRHGLLASHFQLLRYLTYVFLICSQVTLREFFLYPKIGLLSDLFS